MPKGRPKTCKESHRTSHGDHLLLHPSPYKHACDQQAWQNGQVKIRGRLVRPPMISIVATILALSSEIKLKETTLDRLPSQLDLVKGGWCQMRVGQIRGGTLPRLSQTGEGFLLEFDFVEKLRAES